jgi:arylsulfatase A-like enzyme
VSARLSRPPNVVVVVMDCARADVFAAEVARGRFTPFLRELRRESIDFPGAVSPGSWTIPSHASLFTGLYPWDHGAHYKAGTTLPPEPDTLASYLGRAGYATASYSANPYVQPAAGLTRGFEEVAWGGDKEFFLRYLGLESPTNPYLGGPGAAAFGRTADRANPSPLWNITITTLSRYTALWDGVNRVGAKLMGRADSNLPLVAPWIEPRMESWLKGLPADRPAFTFINLLETHEPYLVEAGQPVSLRRWLADVRDVQGEYSWVQGRWTPSTADLARSRARYARTFQAVDERVRRIVEALRRSGRWDNTLFVLTSDHGQAFLENDTMLHRFRVDEPLTRIPLWVRGPGVDAPGGTDGRWVSLIDVPRTVVGLLGGATFGDPTARSLLRPSTETADRPVYSMTDGLLPAEQAQLPAERRDLLDKLMVATYRGGLKAIAEIRGEVRVFRVSSRDPGAPAVPAPDGAEGAAIRDEALKAVELANARITSQPARTSVMRRIAGWGY